MSRVRSVSRLSALLCCLAAFTACGRDANNAAASPLLQTTAAAREAGVDLVAEAETHDVAGLVAAVTSRACSSAS